MGGLCVSTTQIGPAVHFQTVAHLAFRRRSHNSVKNPYLKALLLDLEAFIDANYVFRIEKRYKGFWGKIRAIRDIDLAERNEAQRSRAWIIQIRGSDPWSYEDAVQDFKEHHVSFGSILMAMIESKGLDAVAVYKKANIDRKLFSKIKTQWDYIPGKHTVLALAIAMELSTEETRALLKEAGFDFSPSILFDIIVEYFITHRKYDLDEINAALYTYDQPVF